MVRIFILMLVLLYIYIYIYIIDFKKGYQPGTNIIKDEKGGLVTDFHSILARWRNDLSAAECRGVLKSL
jgi:mannose/fructose/N-acetylgalactosamine-specific phosphotransferase system component IID